MYAGAHYPGTSNAKPVVHVCHADTMQIILFCMADFLMGDLFQ
jgi:hypothetical protein